VRDSHSIENRLKVRASHRYTQTHGYRDKDRLKTVDYRRH